MQQIGYSTDMLLLNPILR